LLRRWVYSTQEVAHENPQIMSSKKQNSRLGYGEKERPYHPKKRYVSMNKTRLNPKKPLQTLVDEYYYTIKQSESFARRRSEKSKEG
jgi:hypothetical protein